MLSQTGAKDPMRDKRILVAASSIVASFGIAACSASVSANLTVPAAQVADTAEDALEEEIGRRPEIDCGSKQIALTDGEQVACVLTDPETGSLFDADVTISGVDGTDYIVTVQVADTPREG